MKRAFLSLFMAAAMLPLGAVTTGEFTNPNNGEKYLTVESDLLQVHYNAAKGGGIRKFFFKPAGVDLTDPESKTQGSATENVWNIATSRFFLKNKPFVQRVIKNDGAVTVQMTGHHEGGGINFLEVCKDYTVKDGSAVLTIDYTFRNLPEAMSTVNYGFWMHHALGVLQAPGSYFYPQTGGIEVPKPTQDIWLYRPSRGWIATANKDGDGVAVTMSFPELKIFYGWFASMKVPTVEWHCVEQAIEEGGEWKTTVQYIPFRGMEGVSGAGNGLVGFIKPAEENPEPEESTSVEVRLWNGNAGDVEIELFRRDAAKEKWRSIDKRQLKFAKGASLQKYALEVGADDDMLVELEAVISQNGKEMARLNAAIPFGEPGRKWSIEAQEASKASSVK
ncbi:MAG: hypothetical protein J6S21_07935, partial [Victivallales bacterium]|nr:hypothetical protein [Victivallales bacterium]